MWKCENVEMGSPRLKYDIVFSHVHFHISTFSHFHISVSPHLSYVIYRSHTNWQFEGYHIEGTGDIKGS